MMDATERYLAYTNEQKREGQRKNDEDELMQNTFFPLLFVADGYLTVAHYLPANCFFNNNDDCVSAI